MVVGIENFGGMEVFGGTSGMFQGMISAANMIMMVFVGMLLIAGVFGIMWVLNEYILSFKTPTLMLFEVGNTVMKKKRSVQDQK